MGAPHATGRGGDAQEARAEDRARLLLDRAGLVVGWSPGAELLLGRPAAGALGRPVVDLLGDVGPARVEVRPARVRDTEPRWEMTLAPATPAIPARPADGDHPVAELDDALLETLFTVSPVGLYLLDTDLRIIRFNPAAEGMENTELAEAVGKRPSEAWPSAAVDMIERVMERVLATRRPAVGVEKRLRPPGDPDHEHVYSASVFPLVSKQGELLGVADATVDVTDRQLARDRLNVLALAGTRIGATLDVRDTAHGLADVSVPGLADCIAVEVLEPVLAGEELDPGPVRPDTVLRRAASRFRDEPVRTRADPAPGAPLPAIDVAADVLTDLEPRILDPLGAVGREAVTALPAGQDEVRSMMLVPLVTQNRALGLALFGRGGERRPFEPDDLTLAAELALRTAACLDNTRRYLRERNALAALQHALRPDRMPPEHTLDVAHRYVQAGSGGDWVDVVPLSGARVALVAGRAQGRGLRTAAAAGRLRAAVHTLSDLDLEPDELLARLDDLARRLRTDETPGTERGRAAEHPVRPEGGNETGSTCLYLVYDPVSGRCSVSSAGHPWPVVVHADGTVAALDRPAGAALGRSGGPFENVDLDLPENSTLALFTQGLCQGWPQEQAGERVAALLDGFCGPVRQACAMLTDALVPARPREDAVVQVARTHLLGPARVASWDLPSETSVVATARSLVAGQLTTWGMDEATFTTELIASELVTNAIRYAKPPVTLRLIRDHALTCEVTDGSSTSPRLRHARTTDEGGRGLLLAAGFSDRWGTRFADGGKTVWVEQNLPEPVRS
ncbi:SpoIIE family protein phosphatase [Streptomyces sp. NPDC089424]|uniref:SpoIIE family protein phosphatase n=1 Tax=Streptomyces sp. NPDC089424 TaxID=3365917 RepID=UPI00382E1CA6